MKVLCTVEPYTQECRVLYIRILPKRREIKKFKKSNTFKGACDRILFSLVLYRGGSTGRGAGWNASPSQCTMHAHTFIHTHSEAIYLSQFT